MMRMKRQALALASLSTLLIVTNAWAQAPTVWNLDVQIDGTVATITYDLAGGDARVTLLLSKDAGATFPFNAHSATGDVGRAIAPGTGKTITWDIAQDYPGECIAQTRIRVVARGFDIDMAMVYVPAGSFEMGDSFGEGDAGELPVHTVTLSAYEIGAHEVTNAQVAAAYNWAYGLGLIDTVSAAGVSHNGVELLDLDATGGSIIYNGSSDQLEVGMRDGFPVEDHPAIEITWYGAVAYCNWLSEWEGRTPVYDLATWERVNPMGGGYRLPTEAEWERAAGWDTAAERQWRYGTSSDSIGCATANLQEDDYCNPLGLAAFPYTSPVGFYAGVTSPVGCYDMSGNVWEWCEDWYSSTYYSANPEQDPVNSTVATNRVLRGGSWYFGAIVVRSAFRYNTDPGFSGISLGFRVVRGSGSR
jgi:formylglycine-generating enzyme required for sulfatase activity